jgi:molecular chaperone GrpE
MAEETTDNDVGPPPAANGSAGDPSEVAALRDRLMRALAETENIRRQAERRAQDAHQYAITSFARELLQVVDNLGRALAAAEGDAGKVEGLIAGVSATDRVLNQILDRYGVKQVSALHQPFDPGKHEAVMQTDQTDQPPGRVVQVLEPGYTLHDRLLRPARVVVAKSPQTFAQPAEH